MEAGGAAGGVAGMDSRSDGGVAGIGVKSPAHGGVADEEAANSGVGAGSGNGVVLIDLKL